MLFQKNLAAGTVSPSLFDNTALGEMQDSAGILYWPLRSNRLVTPKYSAPIPKTAISRIGTIGMIRHAIKYFIFPTIALTTTFELNRMQLLRHGLHILYMCLIIQVITVHVALILSWNFLDKGKEKNNEKVYPRY
jgi:hypothetical protein